MPRYIDNLLPITAKNILIELYSKVLDIIQFHIECAKWSLNSISQLSYTPTPEPPFEVIQYAKRKATDKDYSLTVDFWNQPLIKQWRADDVKILSINKGNYDWLQFLKKNINSPGHRIKINELIREFDNHQWWVFGKDAIKILSEYDLNLPGRF